MNLILWILQALVSITFLYSGICKSIYSIRTLVDVKGQTGVERLPLPIVRSIGGAEILGAFGLLLPWALQITPGLTSITAILLAMVMVPAGVIHYQRHEPKNIVTNVILFVCCGAIAWGRMAG